jgi:murein DD-endopeptidase MepM/ murein hydrolase activator NlpD
VVTLKAASNARIRLLLIIVAAFSILATAFWLGARNSGYQGATVRFRERETATGARLENPSPLSKAPAVSPDPVSSPHVPEDPKGISPPPGASQANTPPLGSFTGTVKLIIPVAGVRFEQLKDTFADARSEGRSHDAIDIMAPAGTPVLAASDGEIVRLFQSERGGTTIYQLSPDKKLVFYYAHLQRYADGLEVGKFARQGDVIAYVGDTGNAGAGNYHLHFSIAVITDPKRYFEGTNINPYPLLRK